MSKPRLIGIAPQIIVTDVVKTVEYYCNILGFKLINYFMDPPVYGMVERDGFQIHFGKGDAVHINANIRADMTDFVIWIPDIDAFYAEVNGNGADIVQEITNRPYGREFLIRDCDGHRILVND